MKNGLSHSDENLKTLSENQITPIKCYFVIFRWSDSNNWWLFLICFCYSSLKFSVEAAPKKKSIIIFLFLPILYSIFSRLSVFQKLRGYEIPSLLFLCLVVCAQLSFYFKCCKGNYKIPLWTLKGLNKSLENRPGWPERSMLAQSRLLAMRKLSFRESGLLNQSGGTAEEEERKVMLQRLDHSWLVLPFLL